MNPKRIDTRRSTISEGRGRRRVAQKYLEVARLIDLEDGEAINVCVGVAVLAGIAAADAICSEARGECHSGADHHGAATLLGRVDPDLAKRLRDLVGLKGRSHYGHEMLTASDRRRALRSADSLVAEAARRLP